MSPTAKECRSTLLELLEAPKTPAAHRREAWERKRDHAEKVSTALGVISALIGSGLLSVLLSPQWAALDASHASKDGGYCHAATSNPVGACQAWRVAFWVSATVSFAFTAVTLILIFGAVFGFDGWLPFAFISFFLSLISLAISMIATSWLVYSAAAAIPATVVMVALLVVSVLVLIPTIFYCADLFSTGHKFDTYRFQVKNNDDGRKEIGSADYIRVKGDLIHYATWRASGAVRRHGLWAYCDRCVCRLFGRCNSIEKPFDNLKEGGLKTSGYAKESYAAPARADASKSPCMAVFLGIRYILFESWKGEWYWLGLVKLLLSSGIDADVPTIKDGMTPIQLAIQTPEIKKEYPCNLSLVRILLKAGVDANSRDAQGLSLMQKAALRSNDKLTSLLCEFGADPNVLFDDGIFFNQPIFFAASIKCGADIMQRDTHGDYALHRPFRGNHDKEITLNLVKALLENLDGEQISKIIDERSDGDGETPLTLAIMSGYKEVVKCLLEKGADATMKNKGGLAPLEVASKENYEKRRNDTATPCLYPGVHQRIDPGELGSKKLGKVSEKITKIIQKHLDAPGGSCIVQSVEGNGFGSLSRALEGEFNEARSTESPPLVDNSDNV